MPEMTPVAQNINPPDLGKGLGNLSSIIGIKQQQQALQTGAYQQQSAKAAATVATQSASENQNLAKLMSDPVGNGLIDADGQPTKDFQKIGYAAAPTTWAQHADDILKAAESKVKFNSSVNNLRASERDEIANAAGGAAAGAEKPEEVRTQLDSLLKSKEGTPVYDDYKRIIDITNQMADNLDDRQKKQGQIVPVGKEGWRQAYLGSARTILGAAGTVGPGGVATPTAGAVQTAGGIQPTVSTPPLMGGGTAEAGPPLQNATPPGTYVDASGRVQYLPPGGAPRTPGAPVASTAGSPSLGRNPTNYAVAAISDAVKAGNGLVGSARTNDKDYGTNVHISNVIRQLGKDTKTGPGTEMFHHMLAGSVPGLGQNAGADYQVIGSMLDRQAAMAQSAMGLPETNAGLQTSQSLSGSTQFAPEALQTKNNLTQALVEGAHQFRHGLDRVAGFNPITDPNKAGEVRKFQSEWTDNFDPNAYRLWNAHALKDADEVARLRKELGPQEFQSLAQKMRNLKSLSETGHLPAP